MYQSSDKSVLPSSRLFMLVLEAIKFSFSCNKSSISVYLKGAGGTLLGLYKLERYELLKVSVEAILGAPLTYYDLACPAGLSELPILPLAQIS